MDGIRLIRLLDVVPINTVRNAPGVSPRSIIVEGRDFTAIDQVLINGASAPSFVVYSPTRLVAEVPAEMRDAILNEVIVLSSVPSLTENSLVEFTLGSRVRTLSGSQRLVQTFVRHLMRTPGSNVFHPTSGGGLGRSVGQNINGALGSDIQIAIANTQQFILAAQTGNRNIPASERLLSAEVVGRAVDESTSTVYVTIVLTSYAGEQSAATLVA